MRYYIIHMTEFWGLFCPALVMMNETEDGKLPKPGKFVGVMLCAYIFVIAGSILSQSMKQPAEGIIRILIVLNTLLFCCILFTGGIAKIFFSMVIVDMWAGVGEMLMTIVYCAIRGKDLAFVFTPQYEGDFLLQWLVQIMVGAFMLLASRKLFHKYKQSTILEGKLFTVLALLYIVIGCVLFSVKSLMLGIQGGKDYPYYSTLFFGAVFFSVFIILLGYNRNKIMEAKFQSLYLKQKMEREYALVFEDMDRDMRRFRHDVKKHINALSYLVENEENPVPAVQIKKYQQDLKEIYTELTYGNYCSKYDVNLTLMEMENVCRRYDTKVSVDLKTLNLDSLPVHIRVQLFENLCEWAEKAMKWKSDMPGNKKMALSIRGVTSAGYHTLGISLQPEFPTGGEKTQKGIRTYIKECIDNGNTDREVKRLLHEYSSTVKTERTSSGISMLIGWHESLESYQRS